MASSRFKRLLGSLSRKNADRIRKPKTFRLDSFELLEDRLVPATYYWVGTTDGLWTTPTNWAANPDGTGAGAVPGSADNAVFNNNASFTSQLTSFNGGVTVNSIFFNSSTAISADTNGPLTIIGDPTLNGNTFADGGTINALALGAASNSVSLGTGVLVGTPTSTFSETWSNISSTGKSMTINDTITYNNPVTFAGITTAPFVINLALGVAGSNTANSGLGLTVNGAWLQTMTGSGLAPAGSITLAGGKLSTGNVNQGNPTNPLVIAGSVTIGDPSFAGYNFTGGNTISALNATVTILSPCSFTGTTSLVTADSTTTFSSTLAVPLNTAINLNGLTHTLTFNTGTTGSSIGSNSSSLINGGKLILAGSGTGSGGNGITVSLNASAPIEINAAGSFLFTGSSSSSTTLTAGTLNLGTGNLTGAPLVLNGGTVANTGTTGRTYTPAIGGSVTFAPTGAPINLIGSYSITAPNVTVTFAGSQRVNFFGTFTVGASGLTLATAGGGGFTFGTTSPVSASNLVLGTNDITVINNGTIGVTFSAQNTSTFTGARTISLSGSVSAGLAGTLAGSLDGTTNPSLILGSASTVSPGIASVNALTINTASGTFAGIAVNGPTVTFGTATNIFTGGVTMNSGTILIGSDTTVANGIITQGPFGVGTVAFLGGTIRPSATSTRTIKNSLILGGTLTFGSFTNIANLIFDVTGTTGGTITVVGPTKITALAVPGTAIPNVVSFAGQITGIPNAGATAASLLVNSNFNVAFTNPLTLTTTLSAAATVGQTILQVATIPNLSSVSITGTITGGTIASVSSVSASVSAVTLAAGLVSALASGATLTYQLNNNPSTFGNLTIADPAPASGAVGARVSFSNQNSLGFGAVTVNFGGVLSPASNFSPPNLINLNPGGTYSPTGATTANTAFNNTGAASVIASGGTVTNGSGQTLTLTLGTAPGQLSLPTAGLLTIVPNNLITFNGAYPSLTGTLVIAGGSASTNATGTNAPTTLSSDGTPRTIAFDSTSGSPNGAQSGSIGQGTSFTFNGLILNADLTLAGGSNYATQGNTPYQTVSTVSSIGTVTETGGSRSITVSLAPSGLVRVAASAAGWSRGTTINSGTLDVDNATIAGKQLGTGGVTLNGGTLRFTNSTANTTDVVTVGASGGTIESFTNGQAVTISGGISGAGTGPLNLRYDGVNAFNGGILVIAGDNRGFDGGYSVSAGYYRGRVLFSGVNSLGSDGTGTNPNTSTLNTITVTAGASVAFDSLATLTAAKNRLILSPGAELDLINLASSNIDLSPTGLNKDFSLTTYLNNVNYTGTLTPFLDTYKFSPSHSTVTISVGNQLTGANNLFVSSPAAGATEHDNDPSGNPGAAVTISAGQNYTGTTSVTGVVHNALMPVFDNGGNVKKSVQTLNIGAALTGTSAITADVYSTINITAGVNTGNNAPITIKGQSTLNANAAGALSGGDSLILGGDTGGGNYAGTGSQTLSALTIANGANTISDNGGLTIGGPAASNYTRTAGGMFNVSNVTATVTTTGTANTIGATIINTNAITNFATFVKVGGTITATGIPAGTTISAVTSNTITIGTPLTAALASGTTLTFQANSVNAFTNAPIATGSVTGAGTAAILVGATLGGTDLVAANAGTLSAAIYDTTQSVVSSFVSGANISNPSSSTAYTGTLATPLAINSLRNTSTVAGAVTLSSQLTIDSGMVMQNTGAAALTLSGTGSITAGASPDLSFNLATSTSVTVSANIAGAKALTKAGGGTLVLSGSGNDIGDIYLQGGTLNANSANALATSATARTLYINGGNLSLTGADYNLSTLNLVVGSPSTGNGISSDTNAARTHVIGGASTTITMNGPLTVQQAGSTTILPNLTFAGQLVGGGPFLLGSGSPGNRAAITLTHNNPTWTGGVQLRNGYELRIATNGASGTGPINNSNNTTGGNTAGNVQIIVTDAATGAVNVPNDMSLNGNAFLSNWKTDTTAGAVNPATFSGKLLGDGGLIVTGFASGGNVSETIFSGTVSVSGAPAVYSYSQTSGVQNFVNGPGGVAIGATNFQSSAIALTGTNNNLVDLPGGTVDTTGAIGFVRFSGANSYIPGQVGPGFLAAVHLGSDAAGAGAFGYLVTGSAAGSVYTLPEGKSYVIGSLGAGSQVGGVLGATGPGTNAATLVGSSKIAGFSAGDVNIHANAVGDVQSLSLLARNAGDTLNLGSASKGLVFTPTFGDSGASTSITLLQTRSGLTTLAKTGLGAVNIVNAAFNKIDGTSARSTFAFTVSAGALNYNQADVGGSQAFAGVTVSGGSFGGNGVINSAVTVNAGGSFSPGFAGGGTLGVGNLSLAPDATFSAAISAAGITQANVNGTVNLDGGGSIAGAVLNVSLGTFVPGINSVYTLISNDGTSDPVVGLFKSPGGATLNNGDTFAVGSTLFKVFYTGGDGNDVVLVEASSPATVYVSNNNFGLGTTPSLGQSIDGDQGAAGTQPAIYGFTAVTNIASALATVSLSGTVVVNAGNYAESPSLVGTETLQLTGGDLTVASIDTIAGTFIDLQANNLITGNATGNNTIAGNFKATTGGLVKTGSDSLTLSGSAAFTGGITVTGAGTLLVDGGTSGSSTVTVGGTATLGGSGAVGGPVLASGTIAPGSPGAPAALNLGDVTLIPGVLSLDLVHGGPSDSIVANSINLTSTVLTLNIGSITAGDTFAIVDLAGASPAARTGTFNGLALSGDTFTVGTVTFSINYAGGNGNDIVLTALTSGGGATLVGSPVLNGGSPYVNSTNFTNQNSMVESIVYSFSSAVSLTAANFTLTGLGGTTLAPTVTPTGSAGNTVWTVTFSGDGVNLTTHSIGDGEYRLALNVGSVHNTYDFFRLLGDLDGNGITDFSDFQSFNSSFNRPTTDPLYIGAADFDGSNTVDFSDFQIFNSNFNKSLPAPLPPN